MTEPYAPTGQIPDQVMQCKNKNPHNPHPWMDRESFPAMYRCAGVARTAWSPTADADRDRTPFPNLETKEGAYEKPTCCSTAYSTNGFQHQPQCDRWQE